MKMRLLNPKGHSMGKWLIIGCIVAHSWLMPTRCLNHSAISNASALPSRLRGQLRSNVLTLSAPIRRASHCVGLSAPCEPSDPSRHLVGFTRGGDVHDGLASHLPI